MSGPSWADGRVGRILGGSNAGKFVKIEQDLTGAPVKWIEKTLGVGGS